MDHLGESVECLYVSFIVYGCVVSFDGVNEFRCSIRYNVCFRDGWFCDVGMLEVHCVRVLDGSGCFNPDIVCSVMVHACANVVPVFGVFFP